MLPSLSLPLALTRRNVAVGAAAATAAATARRRRCCCDLISLLPSSPSAFAVATAVVARPRLGSRQHRRCLATAAAAVEPSTGPSPPDYRRCRGLHGLLRLLRCRVATAWPLTLSSPPGRRKAADNAATSLRCNAASAASAFETATSPGRRQRRLRRL
jgi:hypothetical protein